MNIASLLKFAFTDVLNNIAFLSSLRLYSLLYSWITKHSNYTILSNIHVHFDYLINVSEKNVIDESTNITTATTEMFGSVNVSNILFHLIRVGKDKTDMLHSKQPKNAECHSCSKNHTHTKQVPTAQ